MPRTMIEKIIATKKENPTRYWLGKKRSREDIEKFRQSHLGKLFGEEHPNWRGGLTSFRHIIRCSTKYIEWRKKVFERDNYTCQKCGSRSGNGKKVVLNVDHIKPFSSIIHENNIKNYRDSLQCKELWDLDNGRTLCVDCHMQTDTFGYKALNYNN